MRIYFGILLFIFLISLNTNLLYAQKYGALIGGTNYSNFFAVEQNNTKYPYPTHYKLSIQFNYIICRKINNYFNWKFEPGIISKGFATNYFDLEYNATADRIILDYFSFPFVLEIHSIKKQQVFFDLGLDFNLLMIYYVHFKENIRINNRIEPRFYDLGYSIGTGSLLNIKGRHFIIEWAFKRSIFDIGYYPGIKLKNISYLINVGYLIKYHEN